MLPRARRLSRAAIPVALVSGRVVSGRHLSIKYRPMAAENLLTPSRFALVVPNRQVKTAAARNLLKRRLRHALRRRFSVLQPGYEAVIFPRAPLLELSFPELEQALDNVLKQTRLI